MLRYTNKDRRNSMRCKQRMKWFPIITIFFAGLALQTVFCDSAEAGNMIGSRLTADEVNKTVILKTFFLE